MDRLLMSPNERAAEVDPLEIMFLRLQICNLSNVIATSSVSWILQNE